ncbi:MAG: hypothetical protein H7Z72_15135, partial [Bacteroidetes bacterium]|nr:hypothetical protein [Fibrella sp.]
MKPPIYSILISFVVRLCWEGSAQAQRRNLYKRRLGSVGRFMGLLASGGLLGLTSGAQAQTLPCNYRTLTTNNFSTSIVAARSTAITLGTVTNTANVIDANLTNFGSITSNGLGSGGSISAQVSSTTLPVGSTAGYALRNDALAGASLPNSIIITTYLSGVQQDISSSSTTPLVERTDLAASGQRVLGIVTTRAFDEIRVTFTTTVATPSTLQVFYPLVVYPALSATATATNASNPLVSDGTVSVLATGGRTAYTYTYSGPNTSTTTSSSVITGRATGSYSVTVTDANGCTATAATTVGFPPPFTCAPNIAYLVSSPTTPVASTARSLNLLSGVTTVIATNIASGSSVNGLGFNPTDSYLWGTLNRNPDRSAISNVIVRFDANFVPTYYPNLNVVAGTNSADIDRNGVYHLYNGNAASTIMQRINLSSGVPTQLASLTLSQSIPIGDMAINPVDNNIYSLTQTTGTTSPVLFRITVPTSLTAPATATVVRLGAVTGGGINTVPTSSTSGTRFFGAVYMDSNGDFYAQDNSTGDTF